MILKGRFAFLSVVLVVVLFPAFGRASEYTTISCPNSEWSVATSINATEEIVGYCWIAEVVKGFLRLPDGVLTTFTAPHASFRTFVDDINDSGEIIGSFQKSGNDPNHGFVRNADGVFAEFDPPGSGGTFPASINSAGVIAGTYYLGGILEGFVRDAQGNITTVSVPGSLSTQPAGINSSAEIAGIEQDAIGSHGFLQDAEGNITVFDVPGSDPEPTNGEPRGTVSVAINSGGQVTGWWSDSNNVHHGFTRDASGSFVTFDAPGASSFGTTAASINDAGEVAGWALDPAENSFSFTQSGSNLPVDFRGPNHQTGYGPAAAKINASGKIVGDYIDSSFHERGFFRDVLPPGN